MIDNNIILVRIKAVATARARCQLIFVNKTSKHVQTAGVGIHLLIHVLRFRTTSHSAIQESLNGFANQYSKYLYTQLLIYINRSLKNIICIIYIHIILLPLRFYLYAIVVSTSVILYTYKLL